MNRATKSRRPAQALNPSNSVPGVTDAEYVQRDQPAGVPPLALTGERTLPDVPEEN